MTNNAELIEGIDFATENNCLIALSDSANNAIKAALAAHAYPFTEYLSGLTPDSTSVKTVVNFAPYDGLLEKAKETISKFAK